MTPAEQLIFALLGIASDLVSGALSHDAAKEKLAALSAVETSVDALERAKLGKG